MQFYIIHEDPETSARLLPDYCLQKVNVREGYQILSDIGHIHSVTWNGQNKCYSKSHPTTLMHCKDRGNFERFIDHYKWCLTEYTRRYGKHTKFHEGFANFVCVQLPLINKLPSNATYTQSVVRYILSAKRDKLTEDEVSRLSALVS